MKKGPVQFRLVVQLPDAGDSTADPSLGLAPMIARKNRHRHRQPHLHGGKQHETPPGRVLSPSQLQRPCADGIELSDEIHSPLFAQPSTPLSGQTSPEVAKRDELVLPGPLPNHVRESAGLKTLARRRVASDRNLPSSLVNASTFQPFNRGAAQSAARFAK